MLASRTNKGDSSGARPLQTPKTPSAWGNPVRSRMRSSLRSANSNSEVALLLLENPAKIQIPPVSRPDRIGYETGFCELSPFLSRQIKKHELTRIHRQGD